MQGLVKGTAVWQICQAIVERGVSQLFLKRVRLCNILEYQPRAEAATTNAQLRVVLEEMIQSLGKSHFALIPKESQTEYLLEEQEAALLVRLAALEAEAGTLANAEKKLAQQARQLTKEKQQLKAERQQHFS